MAGSGAGGNRYGSKGGVPAFAVPCAPGAAVSYDSGILAVEAGFFTKWTVQPKRVYTTDTLDGWTVTVYGTIDPQAYDDYFPAGTTGGVPNNGGVQGGTGLDTYSWVILPGPAEQSGTGPMTNPFVISSGSNGIFQFSGTICALRIVAAATGGGTATGTLQVLIAAAP